jgi:hypothetical protein
MTCVMRAALMLSNVKPTIHALSFKLFKPRHVGCHEPQDHDIMRKEDCRLKFDTIMQ